MTKLEKVGTVILAYSVMLGNDPPTAYFSVPALLMGTILFLYSDQLEKLSLKFDDMLREKYPNLIEEGGEGIEENEKTNGFENKTGR